MGRYFNTVGAIKREKHYFIEPLSRFDLHEILSLITQEKYFVMHAPRQTGKTSCMHALTQYLNKEGKYTCLYCNIEGAQAAREKLDKGIKSILSDLAEEALDSLDDSFIKNNWEKIFKKNGALSSLKIVLKEWTKQNPKPVVLILDEIDSLVGDTLISVLRQLRSGYDKRPALFPQSIILCGVRDVRDYRIHSDEEKTIITGGSAFNIKAESLRLGNFTINEIKDLYNQHTKETGQGFDPQIFPFVWELTEGQPWLVNALAYEACFKMKEGKNLGNTISKDLIHQAKENLILDRQTHLDQLVDKLKEDRVRRVLEPILAGNITVENIPEDDVGYVNDLGIIQKTPHLRIANPIYQEIIPRALTHMTQITIAHETSWYLADDGSIDMDKLLKAFQEFFRKHFEHWVEGFDYAEAGAQLLLQAFLQRIVNGGGRVEREYGLGRQRTDLLVIWPYNRGIQQAVIEIKILYGSLETTIEKGLEQTWGYMDKCGTKEGYLLIFDRTENVPWEEKIYFREGKINHTTIAVYGI